MSLAFAALSTETDSEAAVDDVLNRLRVALGGHPANLAVFFSSSHHAEAIPSLASRLRSQGLTDHVIGCTAESLVGEGREVEAEPAIALWALRMPGIRIRPFRATSVDDLDPLAIGPESDPLPTRSMILLGDPFTFPADPWLSEVDQRHPGLPILGGMASGADAPGRNRIVVDDEVHDHGAVGVLVDGAVRVESVVSQGCRPIGRPMLVTKVDRNVILELGRRPAVEVLKELLESLPPPEMERARIGLHLGRAMSEYQDQFRRGDFLIRNVVGLDPRGGVAVADLLRVGQTVQFQVRDAESADEDFRQLLAEIGPSQPIGGLLFTCNGRGTRLFPGPDHDASIVLDQLGPIPVCGFFAMGEFGPVGKRNFLHGFTASLALFSSPESV